MTTRAETVRGEILALTALTWSTPPVRSATANTPPSLRGPFTALGSVASRGAIWFQSPHSPANLTAPAVSPGGGAVVSAIGQLSIAHPLRQSSIPDRAAAEKAIRDHDSVRLIRGAVLAGAIGRCVGVGELRDPGTTVNVKVKTFRRGPRQQPVRPGGHRHVVLDRGPGDRHGRRRARTLDHPAWLAGVIKGPCRPLWVKDETPANSVRLSSAATTRQPHRWILPATTAFRPTPKGISAPRWIGRRRCHWPGIYVGMAAQPTTCRPAPTAHHPHPPPHPHTTPAHPPPPCLPLPHHCTTHPPTHPHHRSPPPPTLHPHPTHHTLHHSFIIFILYN